MAKPKRKWSNLQGTLPAEQPEPSERFKKVLAAKDELRKTGNDGTRRPATMDDFAAAWGRLEALEAEAKAAASERSILFDALELLILEELKKIEAMTGQDTWRGQGQLFSPKFTVCPVVRDKAALRKWIEDTDQADLLSLAPATLKSLTCALLEAVETMTPGERAALKNEPGEPGQPPPGVETYLREGVNRTAR